MAKFSGHAAWVSCTTGCGSELGPNGAGVVSGRGNSAPSRTPTMLINGNVSQKDTLQKPESRSEYIMIKIIDFLTTNHIEFQLKKKEKGSVQICMM